PVGRHGDPARDDVHRGLARVLPLVRRPAGAQGDERLAQDLLVAAVDGLRAAPRRRAPRGLQLVPRQRHEGELVHASSSPRPDGGPSGVPPVSRAGAALAMATPPRERSGAPPAGGRPGGPRGRRIRARGRAIGSRQARRVGGQPVIGTDGSASGARPADAAPRPRPDWLTVPNLVSLARLLLVPVFAVLALRG